MASSLLSGVSGLQAHQRMLDVTGDNLANVSTAAFKSSRTTFSTLLSESLRDASQPTANSGGANPMEIGSGVTVASIDRDMTQGSLNTTGQPLDMAIEGAGYFVLNDGMQNLYTRSGAFGVDAEYYLVDPSTGNRVQRTGAEGVSDGFQSPSNSGIRIPYDTALPAKPTQSIQYTGNLTAEADPDDASTNVLTSGTASSYTVSQAVAASDTKLSALDQATGLVDGDGILITGTRRDGSAVSTTFTLKATDVTNVWTGGTQYTVGGSPATAASELSSLEQASGIAAGDTITITGLDSDGMAVNQTYTIAAGDTLGTLMTQINTAYNGATATISDGRLVLTNALGGDLGTTIGLTYTPSAGGTLATGAFTNSTPGVSASTIGDLLSAITAAFANPANAAQHWSTASITSGQIRLTDAESGYSLTDMNLDMSPTSAGTISLPKYFTLESVGGLASKTTSVEVFDSQGIGHEVTATFVKTSANNTWDAVIASISGDVNQLVDRRISGISFFDNGSFGGMSETPSFSVSYANAPTNVQTVTLDMGTVGEFNGLTQFGGDSTAASNGQDGYESGWLDDISVSSEGVLVGVFTNGIRRDIAALKIATFQNAAGLSSAGNGYFMPTANSGEPIEGKAQAGNAGSVKGESLEQSNVDVAREFVNLIQAQNGYQANARTIKVANEMLSELTNLIR